MKIWKSEADPAGAPPSRYGGRHASMAARPSVQPLEHTAPQRVRPLRKRIRCGMCSLSSPFKPRTTCAPAQVRSSPALEPRNDKGTAKAARILPVDDCSGLTQAQRKGKAQSPETLPRGAGLCGYGVCRVCGVGSACKRIKCDVGDCASPRPHSSHARAKDGKGQGPHQSAQRTDSARTAHGQRTDSAQTAHRQRTDSAPRR